MLRSPGETPKTVTVRAAYECIRAAWLFAQNAGMACQERLSEIGYTLEKVYKGYVAIKQYDDMIGQAIQDIDGFINFPSQDHALHLGPVINLLRTAKQLLQMC